MTVAHYLLDRISHDPQLAYHFDPCTRSMEMLTEAYAAESGVDLEEFRKAYYASLRFKRPVCAECGKPEVAR